MDGVLWIFFWLEHELFLTANETGWFMGNPSRILSYWQSLPPNMSPWSSFDLR